MSEADDVFRQALMDNIPMLAGSLAAVALGIYLMFDDAGDFGKTDRWWHHCYTALIPLLGGLTGLGVTACQIMAKSHATSAQAKTVKKNNPNNNPMFYAPQILEMLR